MYIVRRYPSLGKFSSLDSALSLAAVTEYFIPLTVDGGIALMHTKLPLNTFESTFERFMSVNNLKNVDNYDWSSCRRGDRVIAYCYLTPDGETKMELYDASLSKLAPSLAVDIGVTDEEIFKYVKEIR